jgi:hypothetical protein
MPNKRMQSDKAPATREVEQGHERLSWVGNRCWQRDSEGLLLIVLGLVVGSVFVEPAQHSLPFGFSVVVIIF